MSEPAEPADTSARPRRRRLGLALRGVAALAVWLVVGAAVALGLFLTSSRSITLASHDAVVQPNLSGDVVLHTGALLPDVRLDAGSRIGVDVQLGKTEAGSVEELIQRYAYIGSQPEGQVARVEGAVRDMAEDAALRGAAIGLLPVLLWAAVGPRRRRELVRGVVSVRGVGVGVVVVLVAVAVWSPWDRTPAPDQTERWQPLSTFVSAEVPLPDDVRGIEVSADATTAGTRRLVESAIDTYDRSQKFYDAAVEDAAGLGEQLREPEDGDTVVALVSDRHDNIGMDPVARAIADEAGATAVFNAGDDTSSGASWEAFSIDSVTTAFEDFDDRWAVAGNHDNGDFVPDYFADLGWTMLDGEVVDGPGGTRLLGVDDPRSSGLGTWRDESGLTFDEVRQRLADAACAADEDGDRVQTMLVHDANLGKAALERGCVDLVVGGHVHVADGPTEVVGENDRIGYTYTTGTTGGAAYAIAVGSKLRRPAQVTLLTYADGRPAGLQPVILQTNGRFDVGDYVELTY